MILAITTNKNAQNDYSSSFRPSFEEDLTGPLPNTENTGTDSIPLDGGLSILLAGAAVFDVRKIRKK